MSPDVLFPVREVLLTEDRALVTRRGRLQCGGGPETLLVEGVSPLIVDSSLSARVMSGAAVEIGRAAVRRRWVAVTRPGETEARELARAAEQAADRLRDALEAEVRQSAHAASVSLELRRYAALLTRNAGRGLFDTARAEADIERLRARLFADVARRGTLARERADAERVHRDLKAMLEGLARGVLRLEAALELALDAPAPAEAELEIRYLVPSAMWRPAYEATLHAGASVTWRVQAMVWQRTGEDWSDVALTLSTARPSAGATLPPLVEDRLSMRPKTPEERRSVAADFRDQVIESTALTEGAAPDALPGVDDGGETRVLAASERVDLPSDGRPHRVQVSGFTAPAHSRWLCVPERSLGVFREVSLENRGAEPLLAGPVTLFLDGDTIGLSDIPFVAPGERFALSFGSQDEVVVAHVRTRKVEKRRLAADLTWFVSEATLHHTGSEPLDVEVLQRIPVSELEKVTVIQSPVYTRAGAEGPDAHGHLVWRLRLRPGTREDLGLGFRLDLGTGVNLPDPW